VVLKEVHEGSGRECADLFAASASAAMS
jgi:hypothetical protein